MKKGLVIVESPAKAKTIEKYLGADYKVEASVGHLVDLPVNRLGVDVENGFAPEYVPIEGKSKIIEQIRKAARNCEAIYLAPDPDREGEAIAWHVAKLISEKSSKPRPFHRVTFNEITKDAVLKAMADPGDLNERLVNAQQARRILDRLVGYQISPLLWKKVKSGLSAGRVQSVTVRLICDREQEILKFVPEEYWSILAHVEGPKPPPFTMKLAQVKGEKCRPPNKEEADKILAAVKGAEFRVNSIEKKRVKRSPYPPFITSTLQQEAARRLHYPAKRTMSIAQSLYEGAEVGERGRVGLITYMRTDSVRVADQAIAGAREYIAATYGKNYLPDEPRRFKTKKSAQDAHEAIRPTMMDLPPEKLKEYLTPQQLALYTLIWRGFVASQMADAQLQQTRVVSMVKNDFMFTASGQIVEFPGFMTMFEESKEETTQEKDNDDETKEGAVATLPELKEGDLLKVKKLAPKQHFTLPPPRFTESSLVKELEFQGIGRPSTYASIVSVIQDKEYVVKEKGSFKPTELGTIIAELLAENFPEVMDVKFTALMEDQLDKVEEGKVDWQELLHNFYEPFRARVEQAAQKMRNIKREVVETDVVCEKCGANMVIRWGRKGRFLACPNYPACKNTKEYVSEQGGEIKVIEEKETDQICEKCGRRMVIKVGRKGRFAACPGYPSCKNSKPLKLGFKCPQQGCDGDLVERQSKRGKIFYACNKYPQCNFTLWEAPVRETCPTCGSGFLVVQRQGSKKSLKCPVESCDYIRELVEEKAS
ncbi:MAG: type I DNA topoisomerase [bacterium]